jgi:CelD/BcsL family acetyltransferase involved in cellulose biosynthesis
MTTTTPARPRERRTGAPSGIELTTADRSSAREIGAEESHDSNYTVSVVGSLARWSELANDWNALLLQSRARVLFLTWEWLYAWAECFWGSDRDLFILTVSRAGELVGIAPWCIRLRSAGLGKVRQIEFLGGSDVGSDHLDVFAKRGKEQEVASRIYDFLFREARGRWDTLALTGIPANSLFLLHLLDRIAEDGKHVEIEPGVFCPSALLPASELQFLASLSPNRRAQFRRHHRLLQRSGTVEHSTATTRDGCETSALEALYSLYQWKSGTERAQLYRFLQRFLARAQGRDWAQIDLLAVGGKPVAGLLHLRFGGSLSQYLVATDKAAFRGTSVGNVLVGLCLEQAIAEKLSEYDFLRGGEAHKFHWATGGRRSLNVRLYQRRLRTLLLAGAGSLKALLKLLLR